ncbi:MAG TPA: pitrilysin family protein [Polyangiaceae bacterium]|nr:pitrilysin family protein [Polyangiaceae bacterium]
MATRISSRATKQGRWRRMVGLASVVAAVSAPSTSRAADEPIAPSRRDAVLGSFEQLAGSIERFSLGNGLRVVLAPDSASPTVGISVTYAVGSSSETAGRSGFAHLFEHMMFQGSRNVPKGEHFKLIAARGGRLNGSTDADRTNFYEELPASELALGLWLEADRLRSLQVTEANFQNQRAVVEEEFRMRVQNQPYAPAELRLAELVFGEYWPYAHPVIGSLADLDAAKFDWVRDFHQQYYTPKGAVLAIAGSFEPARARELVEQYFAGIAGNTAKEKQPHPLLSERVPAPRELVVDGNARTPALLLGFLVPPSRTREHYALDLLADVLASGESSRLYRKLVRERAVAQEVSAWSEGHVGPDQLTLRVVLTDTGSVADVESAVDDELTRLGRDGPSLAELARAQQQQRTMAAFGLQSNLERAIRLGEFETEYGDARLFADELKHYLAIIPQTARLAASQYLEPQRAARIEVRPAVGSSEP